MDEFERDEQHSSREGYIYSFRDIIPSWIWNDLPGISPQKKRAHSLKARYVMPLDFSYGFLVLFRQIAWFTILNLLFKWLWLAYFKRFTILIIFIFVCIGIIAYTYFDAQKKNTETIIEEVRFYNTISIVAYLFSLLITFSSVIIPIISRF